MDAFDVLEPGPFTTIQDLGRYGYQRLGIPLSGALDCFALRVANLLVGNRENEACLEVTLAGLKLKALITTTIAVTGADLGAKLRENNVPLWTAVRIEKGQVLTFERVRYGCRAYLAFAGGIDVHKSMGSKSTYVKGRLGGIEGRLLRKGDRIRTPEPRKCFHFVNRKFPHEFLPKPDGTLRMITGLQVKFFTDNSIKRFFESPYRVTPLADRMGVILKGFPLEFKKGKPQSIISEAVVPGTVQIPGDGMPIILLVEQTLGGYPKLGALISADLWKIGQAKPGDSFIFKEVLLQDAVNALRSMECNLSTFRRTCIEDTQY